jgi:hypothetical protein
MGFAECKNVQITTVADCVELESSLLHLQLGAAAPAGPATAVSG